MAEVIALVKRCEAPPTLVGLGTVHDHYAMGRVLGKGRFGVVYDAVNKRTRRRYAIKVVNKKLQLSDLTAQRVLRNEIKVMRHMSRLRKEDCGSILQMHEVYEDDYLVHLVMERLDNGECDFSTTAPPSLPSTAAAASPLRSANVNGTATTPLARANEAGAGRGGSGGARRGGDLFERIVENGRFSEADASRIVRLLLEGLMVIHAHGLVHRDIKVGAPSLFSFALAFTVVFVSPFARFQSLFYTLYSILYTLYSILYTLLYCTHAKNVLFACAQPEHILFAYPPEPRFLYDYDHEVEAEAR